MYYLHSEQAVHVHPDLAFSVCWTSKCPIIWPLTTIALSAARPVFCAYLAMSHLSLTQSVETELLTCIYVGADMDIGSHPII